jgi:hypothetical protein
VRTLYARILLWCFGTLLFSLVAFFAISMTIQAHTAGRRGPFEGMHALELDQARQAYLDGGRAALAAYLDGCTATSAWSIFCSTRMAGTWSPGLTGRGCCGRRGTRWAGRRGPSTGK